MLLAWDRDVCGSWDKNIESTQQYSEIESLRDAYEIPSRLAGDQRSELQRPGERRMRIWTSISGMVKESHPVYGLPTVHWCWEPLLPLAVLLICLLSKGKGS